MTEAHRPSSVGVNTSFAIKRWYDPEAWSERCAALGVELVQFSFDLLDPYWPPELTSRQCARIREACARNGLTLDSAFVGLAAYSYAGLLHSDKAVRDASERWWQRALDLAGEMGATAAGGPLGAVAAGQTVTAELKGELTERLNRLAQRAHSAGLKALLVEPTPLRREWPHQPAEVTELFAVTAQAAVPVKIVLDLGHVLMKPLYGDNVSLEAWLTAAGQQLHGLHLQQTDGLADRHWNFTQSGIVDLAEVYAALRRHGQAECPVVLEVFYPFEAEDDFVWNDFSTGVKLMQEAWNTAVTQDN